MVLDRDNEAHLNHHLVGVTLISDLFIPVHEGNNVFSDHVGAADLVHTAERLEVLPYIYEGLLGVCDIPLGLVLAMEVVVMVLFLCLLKV